ncbi:MAG: hypothetical protein KDD19_14855 [Phaeodactylibacter sp.]|nr:hypothetical protein [Phaeodactylibacter sp.]MCB9048948.1 hypothetical protein [Lewinellaceae bacterium]
MNTNGIFKKMGMIPVMVLILVAAPYLIMFLPREPFFALTREDGLLENISAVYYLVATVGCFWLFASAKNFRDPADQSTYFNLPRRYIFLGLGLLFFISLGEEISWGQRLIGFDTPETIAARNVQGEFNFHNLEMFNPRTMDEQPKEGLAALFTARRVFIALFGFYLLILPLFHIFSGAVRKLTKWFYVPVPPLWMGVAYAGNIILFMALNRMLDDNQMIKNGISEVEELNISFLLMLIPFLFLRLPDWWRKPAQETA